MPCTSMPADIRLCPDLLLGTCNAAVRRVAAIVYCVAAVVHRIVAIVVWFERMAGLAGTQ